MTEAQAYEPMPHYGGLRTPASLGWAEAVASLPARVRTLGVDGPAMLDWDTVTRELTRALSGFGPVVVVDMRDAVLPWEQVLERTETPQLADDPDFATLAAGWG